MNVVFGLIWILILIPLVCSASPSTTHPWSDSMYTTTISNHSGEYLWAGLLPKDGEAMYELEFWNSIKDSTHAEDFAAYLKAYPNGRFAPLAKVRYERYSKDKIPPPKPPARVEDAIKVTPVTGTYVVTTNTNVRAKPTTHSDKIDELISGNTANVIGLVDNKPWYQVKLPSGRTGYVYAPLLEKPARPTVKTAPPKKSSPPPRQTSTAAGSFKDCPECPEMISLPAGSFTMGDNKGDRSEKPAHRVTIKYPFAMGKYEVTVAEWNSCVNAGACKPTSDEVENIAKAPVRDISWADAKDYVKWLSEITNEEYRLPTEAEWEYAARAGTNTTYWWGNSMQSGKANCKDCGGQASSDSPAKVGSYDPNPYGLHDMNGNVWEWVDDCWHRNYSGAPRDGSAWVSGNCSVRVIRSGSWRNDKTYVHSASRFKYDAYIRYIQNGFRIAKSLK